MYINVHLSVICTQPKIFVNYIAIVNIECKCLGSIFLNQRKKQPVNMRKL